jgi:hypothetical protein
MVRLIISMALVMVLGFATVGFAQASQEGDRGCGLTGYAYTGQIASMNETGDRIIVRGAEGDRSFDVPGAATLGGLQVNERVRVGYGESDGKMVASCVNAAPPDPLSKELEDHFRDEMQQG